MLKLEHCLDKYYKFESYLSIIFVKMIIIYAYLILIFHVIWLHKTDKNYLFFILLDLYVTSTIFKIILLLFLQNTQREIRC